MGKQKFGNKLCVICSCFCDNDDDYKIFILDFVHGGEGETETETETETVPNIRIQRYHSLKQLSFCIFNSVIYMFDYSFLRDDDEIQIQSRSDRSCVFKYRLDSEIQNLKLELSMLDKVESLVSPKVGARAIPTPDGRMVCHSTEIPMIEDDEIEDDENLVHFEIYDPEIDSWAQLPQLELRVGCGCDGLQIKDLRTEVWNSLPIKPLRLRKLFSFYVTHSFFISKHTLVLLIHLSLGSSVSGDVEFFVTLDIASPSDQGWQPYESGWLDPNAHFFSPFLVVEDRLSLSCYNGYAKGRDNESGVRIEHQLSEMPVFTRPEGSGIALADYRPNQECWFYGVRTRGSDMRDSYMVIDYFRYALPTRNKKKLRKKKMVAAAPQFHLISSFRFRIPEPDLNLCVLTAAVLPRTIFPFPT